MAITYVGGVVAGRTGNSNATVDVSLSSGLTGGSNSGVSAGDLVIVTVCTASQGRSSVVAVTAPATYQNLTAQRTTATTYDTNVQVSYKFMPTTPDSVVTIPAQGNIADGQAYAVQVFRGVDPNTPLDVTPTYATGSGTNNNPNPAAITPVTAGAWIVVTGGGASATGTTLYTASYLTNFLTQNGADTNDGTVGAGYYTGWTSGPYDPAAFGGGSTNAANSWGTTTIALRPAPEAQTLTPTLYSNGQTFYAPTISVGAVTLSAVLYENSNTFYTHTVTQPASVQDLLPTLYTNTEVFYSPTITVGNVNVVPSLYTNNNVFYSAEVLRGAVNLISALYTNTNTFYTPTIQRGAVNLSTTLYTNTNDIYNHSVSVGQVSLNASLYNNNNTFYTLHLSLAPVNLTATLFENTNNVFSPAVSVGTVYLVADRYNNTNEFYAINLSQGSLSLSPSLLTNENSFFTGILYQTLIGGFPLPSTVMLGVPYGDTMQYVGELNPYKNTTLDLTSGGIYKQINKNVGFTL